MDLNLLYDPGKLYQMRYSGGKLTHVMDTPAYMEAEEISIGDGLVSIVVATNVATITTNDPHGLYVGARVTITGTDVTGLAGTYFIATVPSTTTYTIATSGVTDGTYGVDDVDTLEIDESDIDVVISTSAPKLTSARWCIRALKYSGSDLIGVLMAPESAGYRAIAADYLNY